MTDMMKSILARVLSQELAHQENWQADDMKRFGKDKMDRDNIKLQIKEFMKENDINFRQDFYWEELR